MPARATLNGTITATGGANCTQRGFEWGTVSGNYPNSWTETGSYGIGAFNHIIDSLDLDKTYYFRAKALNSAGWGYGSEKSFVTPPSVVTKFRVPMVRLCVRPLPRGKLLRDTTPITIRKSYFPFQTQTPIKDVSE